MPTTKYQEYLDALRGVIYPISKLQFMNPDNETVAFEVIDDFHDGSTLSVQYGNGARRTADITLTNISKKYDVGINKIWFGQQVKLFSGLLLHDGTEFYLPQGVFYVKNPEDTIDYVNRSVSLHLVDKWSYLDGSLFGNLPGVYQINVGDNLFVAIQQLLLTDRGNGTPLDSVPPVLDSYYRDKTTELSDGRTISVLEAPYTIRIDADKTYADVLLELATMLVASIGYDCHGHLRVESVQTDVLDSQRPIRWSFSTNDNELLSGSYVNNMTDVYNDIRVVGAVLNGKQIQARATNTNPASDCNVNFIGYKTKTITQSKYYSFDQCTEYAKYELRRCTAVPKTSSFTTSQIFHIQENDLITILNTDKSNIPEKHLVTGFSLPLGGTGTMSISTVPLSEFDVFEKWHRSHTLHVLCSNVGALSYSYGVGNSLVTGLTNPYDIVEIPSGMNVTFEVVEGGTGPGFKYTIHSAELNGVSVAHNGRSCTFAMPDGESSIVFQLTAVNGNSLSLSYDGDYTSSEVEMNGVTYKLYMFTSSGSLVLSEEQISKGVLVDLWARGGGGGSSSTTDGKNAYDAFEYVVSLKDASIPIVVGTGGVTGSTAGTKGNESSFGSYLSSAGGGAAYAGINSVNEGALTAIYNFITNTVNGAGGNAGFNGETGVCYMRIAMDTSQ